MNLHYSLYQIPSEDEMGMIFDLSKVGAVEFDDGCFWIYHDEKQIPIDMEDYESFLTAWNRYKYAASAAQLLQISDINNPTIACNSAFRLDDYLGFLASQKQIEDNK